MSESGKPGYPLFCIRGAEKTRLMRDDSITHLEIPAARWRSIWIKASGTIPRSGGTTRGLRRNWTNSHQTSFMWSARGM